MNKTLSGKFKQELKKVHWTLPVCIAACLFSSCGNPSRLEVALQAAGPNRVEMEKVLEHFSRRPVDSLKYKATRFLIENMPGHVSCADRRVSDALTAHAHAVWTDRMAAEWMMLHFLDGAFEDWQAAEDIKTLTGDFLIAHIESVFRQKERCAWLRDFPFDDFCEHLLPYKLATEHPVLWRDSTADVHNVLKDDVEMYDDTRLFIPALSRTVDKNLLFPSSLKTARGMLPSSMRSYVPDCRDFALHGLLFYRLCGIPAAIDLIPCWGSDDGAHSWAQPISSDCRIMDKLGESTRRIPKVYRRMYSRQRNEETTDEYIPPLFRDVHLKAVTDEYVYSVPVEVSGFPIRMRYGYLCVFNRGKWTPVARASNNFGKCVFLSMGKGVVYLPVCYDGEEQMTVSAPFVVEADGNKRYLQAGERTERLELLRKHPVESWNGYFMRQLKEYVILAGETEDDLVFDTLEVSGESAPGAPVRVELEKPYRYFRIVPQNPTRLFTLSEVYFLNGRKRIYGEVSGATPRKECLSDGDVTVAVGIRSDGVSFSFAPEDELTSLCLLPRNDGNGIYPDAEYELFYFAEGEWRAGGKKKADDFRVKFGQAPQGAVFWLRNETTGKKERIFTYEDGRQRFW